MPIGQLWQTLLETPLINFMVALSALCFGSFGLAILLFTVISRLLTFPLTLRTLHSMRSLQQIQPLVQEVQKKYSDPRRRSEEQMKIYREHGVNPLGCLGPQLIQIPLFIALYSVIQITLGNTPERVVTLSSRLYDIDFIQQAIPLTTQFLWIDLAETGNIPLVVAVFASTWLQQRISSGRTTIQPGSQQAQMNQMMQWMMPAMFAWFTLAVPAGLALYWTASTVIGIVLQWAFVGPGDFTWRSLIPGRLLRPQPALPAVSGRARNDVSAAPADGATEARNDNDRGDERTDRRGSRRQGAGAAGPRTRSGRRRRNPRG